MSSSPAPDQSSLLSRVAGASLKVGTRGSALAQWQTDHIISALKRLQPHFQVDIRIIKTEGDKDQVRPLAEIGGLGVFTKAIEDALLSHEIDLAVHSLKDLPTEIAKGLTIAAIPERQDPRDCLVSRHKVGLLQLPPGALIGTSSARRAAQVLALRPDVQIVPLRGNVDTRLRKAQSEEYDAVILAAAGITRLGRADEITEYLPLDQILPDPGQGALAVQIRSDDTKLESLVAKLDHAATRAAVTAERSFLRGLGGGCRMPIGAYAQLRDGQLFLRGVWASDHRPQMRRGEISGEPKDADALGQTLAARLERADVPMQNSLPLRGKRILVTRAREQAETLLEKIRALGGDPVPFPTIDFVPLDDFHGLDAALARGSSFDWIVFTSANGVRHVIERLKQLGREPQSILQGNGARSPKLAAIGPATARSLAELGLHVDFVPTKFLGEQIAAELPVERGASALLLRADLASDVLARGLTLRGVVVTDVDAYRTILPAAPSVDLSAIDAITFTSSSTVRNFLEMLDGKLEGLDAKTVFCIGPVTAGTARELGLRVDAIAPEHTVDGLVSTLLKYYEERDNHA